MRGLRVRDSQRAKLYKAERNVWRGEGSRFVTHMNESDLQDMANHIWNSSEVQQNFPRATVLWRAPPIVKVSRRKPDGAYATLNDVVIGRVANLNWILVHEMAHVVVTREHSPWIESHGIKFCDAYLLLTEAFMGKEAKKLLRDEFINLNVKHEDRYAA